MNIPLRSVVTRIGLAGVLLAGAAGPGFALEGDLPAQAVQQISTGESQDAVRSRLGEPAKSETYLFAPGQKTWYYYIEGGTLGNEPMLEVRFDESGVVQSVEQIEANMRNMNRYD